MESKPLSMLRHGELCLAPMVRVGGLPFRALCLKYGADKVWCEEIIARRISQCTRVENPTLGTIDFVHAVEKPGREPTSTVIFRTAPELEKGKLIFQMGAGSAADALEAALVVHKDVAGIDVNMGCPMKFSIQGGMGAALLHKPDVAADIIRTLRNNINIPVTAKIRLFDTVEETLVFMRNLEQAGASAITVHFRRRAMRPRDPADWSGVKELVEGVSIPVYVNGDFYEPSDICHAIDNLNCAGVLLARPLLLNPSLLRFRSQDEYGTYTCSHNRFLTLAETIVEYLNYCVCYELPYQLAKYTIMEMMNTGRHTKIFLGKMKDIGLDCGRLSEFEQVQSSGSLEELIKIFSGFANKSKSSDADGVVAYPSQLGDTIGSENGTDKPVHMSKKDCDKLRRNSEDFVTENSAKHRRTVDDDIITCSER